ncbi:unnamed protein product [Protopolystoma xenopodis]|uniref:Uncharacterized protein n=1 Tax=Protopolystoma xenopodis TaxID=117903 RepID=A0A448X5X4_9PLAT|nr:unnamed protein product [Protopolystoma xenopodis]
MDLQNHHYFLAVPVRSLGIDDRQNLLQVGSALVGFVQMDGAAKDGSAAVAILAPVEVKIISYLKNEEEICSEYETV